MAWPSQTSWNLVFLFPCEAAGLMAKDPFPNWSSLQTLSFLRWTSTLCRQVLRSCISFAHFLWQTLRMIRMPEEASAKALFPIPLPEEGVLTVSSGAGSREKWRRSFDQAVRITVMVLNLWYFSYEFPPLSQLTLALSSPRARVLDGIWNVVEAFGSCEDMFQIPLSGRKCSFLVSQRADLCDLVAWEGLAGVSYFGGFKGSDESLESLVHVPADLFGAPELIPCSSLNLDRLKIAGSAQWGPPFHMSDSLRMAFCESVFARWTRNQRTPDTPDLHKEDYQAVRGWLKIRDAKGLFCLRDEPLQEEEADLSLKFSNCHKNLDLDRWANYPRSKNLVAGIIPGASQCFPPALMWANLALRLAGDRVRMFVSDGKDFYFWMKVTPERLATNALWPPVFREEREGTIDLVSWCEENLEREEYDRLTHVGLSKPDSLLRLQERQDMPDMVQGCFSNVPQGDRLGVGFAVDAHRDLLRSPGFLHDREELRADRLSQGRHLAPGPVIEDFYAVSFQHGSNKLETSLASQHSQVSMKAYEDRKLFGSTGDDAVGADVDASFKFVDSNDVPGDDPRVWSLFRVSQLSQSFLEIRFEKESPQVSYVSLGLETLTGTTLVRRPLVLNDLVSDSGSPRLLEHSHRTKMRRLEEMQGFLEMRRAQEVWTAGCMFGSIHDKRFVCLRCNVDREKPHQKCGGLHQHVRIEGQYTKRPEIYPDELAETIACQFDAAPTRKLRIEIFQEPQTAGLEGPLRNEVSLNACWRLVAIWTFTRPMHSSSLETLFGSVLTEVLIFFSLGFRQFIALDSNVGSSVSVRGFSLSFGLRPCVHETGVIVVVGRLNMAYQFATTRLNPADHPTRENMISEPSQQAWSPEFLFEEPLEFAEAHTLLCPAAKWVQLFILVQESLQEWLGSEQGWRFAHVRAKHFPYLSLSAIHSVPRCVLDFGSTLSYLGGGPLFVGGSAWVVWIWFGLAIGLLSTFSQWAGCVSVWTSCRRSMRALSGLGFSLDLSYRFR